MASIAPTWLRARVRVVAMACCGALLAACASAPAAAPGSPSPATTAPPVAHASSPAAASAATTRDNHSPAVALTGLDGAVLQGVTASPDGMLAVGSAGGAVAAWRSADGAAWQNVHVADTADGRAMRAVALVGDTGVAFGGSDDGPSRQWTVSEAGQVWRADGPARGIDGRVNAVAGDGGRWVAVGDMVDAESGTAAAGAVWASDDGAQWTQLAEVPVREGTFSDVAVRDDTVVAVGFDVAGGVVWTSIDGEGETVDDDTFDAASIEGVAATPDGFVALGRGLADLRPVVWTSTDGRRWERDGPQTDVFAPDRQINEVATVGNRLVAVGSAPEGGSVWTSDDGVAWTAAP